MKAAQLRQGILQAAVQGKLVPQNLHDEPASMLLERIQVEKSRLIKEGKVKKEHPLPPINEDEIPYDLPDGWSWCRLNDLYNFIDYRGKTPSKIQNGIPLITGANIKKGYMDYSKKWFISQSEFSERKSRGIAQKGDILFTTEAPLGNAALADIDVYSTGQRIITFQSYLADVRNNLFLFFLLSPEIQTQIFNKRSGMTASGIKAALLKLVLIPIPPLQEQYRINAKINELMSYCDELEAAEKELDALESNFAEYLPKSILQAAVQGKLVPQNLHDEPASELLKRIQTEKARLIKEGKIKKEKPLPTITEDEIPYDLPDGWAWCRLGNVILQNIGGGTPSKSISEYWNGDIPWASVKDLSGKYLSATQDHITKKGLTHSTSNLIPEGNIIVCTRMGLGKISINTAAVAINQDLRALFLSEHINKDYFIYYYQGLSITGSGMTVKGITIEELNNLLLPLPPLAEQFRIVSKTDELLALCQQLKNIDASRLPSLPNQQQLRAPKPVLTFEEAEEHYAMAARGDVAIAETKEHQQAMADLFGDGADG